MIQTCTKSFTPPMTTKTLLQGRLPPNQSDPRDQQKDFVPENTGGKDKCKIYKIKYIEAIVLPDWPISCPIGQFWFWLFLLWAGGHNCCWVWGRYAFPHWNTFQSRTCDQVRCVRQWHTCPHHYKHIIIKSISVC